MSIFHATMFAQIIDQFSLLRIFEHIVNMNHNLDFMHCCHLKPPSGAMPIAFISLH